ncbi:MAG: hypothetical protein H7249_03280 [Chitinophagaceae bacterium]|nr:hypothetical protein [Oligoflexus sp.]
MKWDKRKLHSVLLETMKAELHATLSAAETAKEGANHEDAVAKSKYDTHGLELSYLAGSQFERARAAESKIALLQNSFFKDFDEDDEIDLGALVFLQGKGPRPQAYLISDLGAGLDLTLHNEKILVISPESPLGEALMGLYKGDAIDSKERQKNSYTVVGLC